MNSTQMKVSRNLAGIEFLMNRSDVSAMIPQSEELDKREERPAFYVCRAIMRDNLSVICVSLRVGVMTFGADGEKYTDRDIHGQGTTFEMALFDLSAQLISLLGNDDVIDMDSVPILEQYPAREEGAERNSHGDNKSVRANESDSPVNPVTVSDKNAGKGMEARSDGTGGSRASARKHSRSGRSASNGCSGRMRSQRTC